MDRTHTLTEQMAHKTDHTIVGALVARTWGLPEDPDLIGRAFLTAHGVLALATVVTVWTGVEYALAARRALKA
jgi:HD-like signal output (HDOD) protein